MLHQNVIYLQRRGSTMGKHHRSFDHCCNNQLLDCHYNCVVVKALVELFFLVFPLSHHSPFFSKMNKNKQKKDWNDLQVVIDVKCFIWKDTSRSRLGQSCYGFQFQNSLIFFLTKHITDDPIIRCSMQYPPTYLHIHQKWTL